MTGSLERDLGRQPIADIMALRGLKPHDIVASSSEQITHKMIARAVRGRRLTLNVQRKIASALNRAAGERYPLKDLFNY